MDHLLADAAHLLGFAVGPAQVVDHRAGMHADHARRLPGSFWPTGAFQVSLDGAARGFGLWPGSRVRQPGEALLQRLQRRDLGFRLLDFAFQCHQAQAIAGFGLRLLLAGGEAAECSYQLRVDLDGDLQADEMQHDTDEHAEADDDRSGDEQSALGNRDAMDPVGWAGNPHQLHVSRGLRQARSTLATEHADDCGEFLRRGARLVQTVEQLAGDFRARFDA